MQRALRLGTVLSFALALALGSSAPAYAQGGGATSAIAGVIIDSSGGVIPGATVTATNNATAGKFNAVSGVNGTFTIPALAVGKYTVTVTLQGFKTAVLKEVDVSAGAPAEVRVTLEVGGFGETVTVETASEVVRTTSAAIATTINTKQIQSLPLGRDLLNGGLVTFLPGVMTPGSTRDSTINGLPQSSINITLDGVSIQDNYLKTTDGFFARVSPRLDAIEEVTVTMAASGADAAGMGATSIKFTTRSGSNQFSGSGYYYFQHQNLNTKTYNQDVNNLPRSVSVLHQPGVRVGGPVVMPGIYDGRGKLFFFVNYEESLSPRTGDRTTNFLSPEAMSGLFRYDTATGVQTVDLYDLARRNGQLDTADPTIFALLQSMKSAIDGFSGGSVEPLAGNYTAFRKNWQDPTSNNTYYPTIRMDYNLKPGHVLSGSWNYTNLISTPDTTNTQQRTYPGFAIVGSQLSKRYTFQTTVRSTFGANIVNEARYGMSGGATQFSPDKTAAMWSDPAANQNGFGLNLNGALGIANAGSGTTTSAREASTKFVEDNVTWLRGPHTVAFGGQYTSADVWLGSYSRVPGINFGVVTGDPALAMFSNAANFPGSTPAQRTAAQNMYAGLTGRVSSITGNVRLDPNTLQYVYLGDSLQEGQLPELDFYVQDNWRVKPNLTINAGMRYVLQFPFHAKNGSYSTATLDDVWGLSGNVPECDPSNPTPATCNLFKAGQMPGIIPTYQNLGKNVKAYNTDWDNIAPMIGLNWTPSTDKGWLRTLLGREGDSALSGGWSRSYERHGMSDFTGVFGNNPGINQNGDRSLNNGNLGSVPVLFRSSNLGPPATCSGGAAPPACIPEAPTYPIPSTVTASVNIFDPNLQVPYSDSWTVGFQRSVGALSAIEVRYVGTRNRQQWTTYDMNETNVLDNNFLTEFRNAQANLYANMAGGRGQTFAYFGPGTGTVPLPIYLGYFNGSTNVNSPAAYSGANWSTSTFINPLNQYAPNIFTAASGLNGQASFRSNAFAAGIPRNYFVANPDTLGGANVTGFGGYTEYNGFQVQFRRRLSDGLQFDANYATGAGYDSDRYSFRVDRKMTRQSGGEGDVAHALKSTFVYQVPFGQGRHFGANVGSWTDRLIGGWQMAGTIRLQTGRLIDLGNVRIVGMSEQEARDAFQLRKVSDTVIYMWPDDIMDNSIKAYSRDFNGYTLGAPTGRYFGPANGVDCMETISNSYGDCGVRTFVVQGPVYKTMDLNFIKLIPLAGRKSVEVRVDAFNVFNTVNFTPISGVSSTTQAGYQLSLTGASSGRVVQLVGRFNW